MFKLILNRLMVSIPVLLAVITITFFMVHSAPGGPFDFDRVVSPEVMEKLNEKYNLDAPLYKQYLDYIGNVIQGDFGPSFRYPGRWFRLRPGISRPHLQPRSRSRAEGCSSHQGRPRCNASAPLLFFRRS